MNRKIVTQLHSAAEFGTATALVLQAEAGLPGLVALDKVEKRRMLAMGARSQTFCRRTLEVLAWNPKLVPGSVDLPEAQLELAAVEQLDQFEQVLQHLLQQVVDTRHALGARVLKAALDGYHQIKRHGQDHGLHEMHRELSGRFSRSAEARARAKARRQETESG